MKTENRTLKTEHSLVRERGFTLLEIMVVLFLIALTVGIVSINLRHDSSEIVETEARRFVALVDQMCQESIAQGRVLALTGEGATAYKFVVFGKAKWEAVKQDDIFRRRQLPEGVSLNLDVEDSASDKDKAYLRCEPDGFMTPFSAEFDLEGVRYRVLTNEMREMEISAVQ
ncbi:MAG: prepilin-type N-terminal cleavage/methylation domain-containing protein [Gammaproteobacteria bacterium]|nr:prepilin-type N-terminal cleavage/methylation domain-containing protein [Gammaproteobacteria bacterium]